MYVIYLYLYIKGCKYCYQWANAEVLYKHCDK